MNTTSLFSLGLAIVGTALTFAMSAGPAVAAPVDSRSVSIIVNPSDLATVSGRSALDARIERAARRVCAVAAGDRSLSSRRIEGECVGTTVARTQAQVAALKTSRIELAAR